MDGGVLWFGEPDPDPDAWIRPSVYVVIRDSRGYVAAVRAPQGLFLPGGGVEAGESPRESAARETVEEAGLVITVDDEIGVANECILAEAGPSRHMVKQSTFFQATVVTVGEASELDHSLVWLNQSQARTELTYASHRWAVEATIPEEGSKRAC